MSKVGGRRNFGYGKQMAWAGKQAIRDKFGDGHYGTVAGHTQRWTAFADWCRSELDIRDARDVDREVLEAYGQYLRSRVDNRELSVVYAQNRLSTVNVVLERMRGDRQVRIAPAATVGQRTAVRTEPPAGLDRNKVHACARSLWVNQRENVACVVLIAREFGLRVREASMLDAKQALRQSQAKGAINVTAGTKGGRGHHVDRWVPVSETAAHCLARAAQVQGDARNLIPPHLSWDRWYQRMQRAWTKARGPYGLGKTHDLRAAYACERYKQLTGSAAPVIAGRRIADPDIDHYAREVIAQELGHARPDVAASYIGGAR